MKIVKKVTQEITVVKCDVCGETDARHVCSGCRCDLCRKCANPLYTDPWTGDDNGDYPSYVCDDCESLLGPAQSQARALRRDTEDRIENLWREWRDLCTEKRNKQ